MPVLVDAILANTHRNDDDFIKILYKNGTYTQKDYGSVLKGAHWSKSVRGFSIEALKLLTDQTGDRFLVEYISNSYS